jgi:hypothetical protein
VIFYGWLAAFGLLIVDTVLVAPFAYIILLIMNTATDTTRYMRNQSTLADTIGNMKGSIEASPEMKMYIRNWHWTTKTKKDSKGNKKKVKEKKYTKSFKKPYKFTEWVDKSPPPENLEYIEVLHLTRLETEKVINMSSRAHGSYEVQKHEFIKKYWKDKHYDYTLLENIPGTQTNTLIVNEALGGRPLFLKNKWVCMMDLLCIGWLPRLQLDRASLRVEFRLEKYIIQ